MTRFLLDEHVARAYVTQLVRRNRSLVVIRVGDGEAPPKETSDAVLLRYCEEHDFLLITNNRRTMPVHLREHLEAGRHMPGILMIPGKEVAGEIIDDLLLIAAAGDPEDFIDRIVHLPL